MPSNKSSEVTIFDNIQSAGCTVQKPTASYTVLSTDNVIIAGASSLAITLDANSNSPVWITSIDGATQRTSTTILANSNTYKIEDGAPSALCVRVAQGSLWMIVGAKSIS